MSTSDRVVKRLIYGFTVVELLVVLGVLAVLMTLLLPAIRKARQLSYGVRCLNNVGQIGTAMLGFASRNDGRLPGGGNRTISTSSSVGWQTILDYEFFPHPGNIPRAYTANSRGRLGCPVALMGAYIANARMFAMNYKMNGDNPPALIGLGAEVTPPTVKNT